MIVSVYWCLMYGIHVACSPEAVCFVRLDDLLFLCVHTTFHFVLLVSGTSITAARVRYIRVIG
jgi:hypothetical protein